MVNIDLSGLIERRSNNALRSEGFTLLRLRGARGTFDA